MCYENAFFLFLTLDKSCAISQNINVLFFHPNLIFSSPFINSSKFLLVINS